MAAEMQQYSLPFNDINKKNISRRTALGIVFIGKSQTFSLIHNKRYFNNNSGLKRPNNLYLYNFIYIRIIQKTHINSVVKVELISKHFSNISKI